ncbi:MAG: flagellar export protein FliJ [Bryobacteraceae bacterium]
MKAFRFTLEAVQTLRKRQEHQATELYVRSMLARQQAADLVESVREQILINQREMNRLLSAGCTASAAFQASTYQCALEKRLDERILALSQAERRVNAAFQAMLSARRQTKIVEKYRQKQLAHHQRNALREDQKLLDDLASRRAGSILSWNSPEVLP